MQCHIEEIRKSYFECDYSKEEAYELVDVKEFGSNCSEHIVKDHDTRVVYLLCEEEER